MPAAHFFAFAAPALAEIRAEIQADGSATFIDVNTAEATRHRLWTVSCRQPLRGCVARSGVAYLTIDRDGLVHLSAFLGPTDRISIAAQNYTADRPDLFSRPLSHRDIAFLSADDAEIVIEFGGAVVDRIAVPGLDEVARYVLWLSSDAARAGGDARHYVPDRAPPYSDTAAPEMSHLQEEDARSAQPEWQLVPHTKPQIEFAIRSQGGASFRVPD